MAVFSMLLTCFLRLVSKNFDASVTATMMITNRTRKLTMNGTNINGPYEISTTVWKIEDGSCIPQARSRS